MASVITVCAVAQLIVISLQQVATTFNPPSILPLISKTLTDFPSGEITVIVPGSCQSKQISQQCLAGKWVWTLVCKKNNNNNNNITVEVINPTNPTVKSISVTYYDKNEQWCVAKCGNGDTFSKGSCFFSTVKCITGRYREKIKIEKDSNTKVKITFDKDYMFPVSHCSNDNTVITQLNSTISILPDFPDEGITVTVPQSCQNWLITQPCPSNSWVWKLNCTNNTNQVTVVVMNLTNYESDSVVTPHNVTRYSTDSLVLSLETEGGCVLESTGRCVCVNNNTKQDPTACNEHGEQINITVQDDETVKITFNKADYMLDDGSSLKFNPEPINWIDALKWCKKHGASLVELTKPTGKHGVKCLLKNHPDLKTGVWIGLERSIIGTNADWQWISGSKDQISPWNSSFPVNRYNNHCGQLVWNNQTEVIEYLDGHCHRGLLPFICQGEKLRTLNTVG